MMNGDGFGTAIIIFGLICAVAGWGAIEIIIWIFSFVHISFGV